MPTTARDIVTAALVELTVVDAIDPVPAELATFGLQKLNLILDNWNAEHGPIYADAFSTFTTTPSLSPHTIGPSGGTWTLTMRPSELLGAHRVVGGIGTPLNIRDAAWWDAQSSKTLTGTPTDVYLNPTWPLGSLYFWPVPSSALSVAIRTRVLLAQMALSTTVELPAGYRSALTLTLAEDLAPSQGAIAFPSTVANASKARARIAAGNRSTPRLVTADSGMPGYSGGSFDFQTREIQ